MLLTFLASVKAPRNLKDEIDGSSLPLYNSVWIMHVSASIIILLNQSFSKQLGILKNPLNTAQMIFTVIVMIFISMEFFAKKEKKEASSSKSDEKAEETSDKEQVYDAEMLRGWYAIEVLVFMSNIISNIIFILARSWSRIRILNTRTNAVVNPNTDMIEEQQILVSLFSSFITPFIVSLCLMLFGFDSYPKLTNEVWEWLFFCMLLQLTEAIVMVYVTFIPYRKSDEGESCFNRCMPAFHNILAVLLFLGTPILFLVAYFTLLGTVETKVLFLYFTFLLIHTFCFTVWFFIVLIDVFEGLKMENASQRRQVAKADSASSPTKTPAEGDSAAKSPAASSPKKTSNSNKEEDETEILPGYAKDKPMTFREDLYCLLYVSLVKPQYKMYCDLVAKTGEAMPDDLDEPIKAVDSISKADTILEEGTTQSWWVRIGSFICCRRPKFDEDGNIEWTYGQTLILGVMKAPGKSNNIADD